MLILYAQSFHNLKPESLTAIYSIKIQLVIVAYSYACVANKSVGNS